jgi:hypothetical protein
MLSKEYYLSKVDNSDFSTLAHSEIQVVYASYAAASGIKEEVLVSMVTEEDIRLALKQTIESFFTGSDGIDFVAFADKLEEDIVKYAVAEGFEDNTQLRDGLQLLIEYCTASFLELCDSLLIEMVGTYAVSYKPIVTTISLIAFAFVIICIAAFVFVTRRLSHVLRNLIYVLSATTISTAAIPLFIGQTGLLDRINITPQSMKSYIVACLSGFVSLFWIVCVCSALLLGFCIVVYFLRKKQRAHRRIKQ